MRTLSTIALCAMLIGLGCGPANAVTVVCVNAGDATDFQTKLNNAVSSGAATTLEVPRGTYHLGGSQLVFNATAMAQGQLDISGGFSSDCSTHIDNPALTIIDGDAMSGVLSLTSTGGVSVRYLTIQNGLTADNPGLVVSVSGGGIIINYNIIQNNRASDERAGLEVTISGSGDVHIDGNLIAGNSANTNVCAGEVDGDGTGNIYVTNNTVANNTITGPLVNGYGGLAVFGNTSASNNIFWGNTSLDIGISSGAVLVNNDYGTISGNPSSNTGSQSVDPQFVGSGNFQLAATSPLLAQGTISPAGGLPTIDILGHDREFNATTTTVDMGAYERGDEIFNNGYDD